MNDFFASFYNQELDSDFSTKLLSHELDKLGANSNCNLRCYLGIGGHRHPLIGQMTTRYLHVEVDPYVAGSPLVGIN